MIDRIRNAVAADDESDTEWDGYMSTRAEWHAAVWGFAGAFLAAFVGDPYLFVSATGWIVTRGSGRLSRELLKEAVYVVSHALPGLVFGMGMATIYAYVPV